MTVHEAIEGVQGGLDGLRRALAGGVEPSERVFREAMLRLRRDMVRLETAVQDAELES